MNTPHFHCIYCKIKRIYFNLLNSSGMRRVNSVSRCLSEWNYIVNTVRRYIHVHTNSVHSKGYAMCVFMHICICIYIYCMCVCVWFHCASASTGICESPNTRDWQRPVHYPSKLLCTVNYPFTLRFWTSHSLQEPIIPQSKTRGCGALNLIEI